MQAAATCVVLRPLVKLRSTAIYKLATYHRLDINIHIGKRTHQLHLKKTESRNKIKQIKPKPHLIK